MSSDQVLQDFVARMAGRPHLAAKIIKDLHIRDILSLLIAGKVFKDLFWIGAFHDSIIRSRVNDDLTLIACVKGNWYKHKLGTIQEEDIQHQQLFDMNWCECFAFQSAFWTFQDNKEGTQLRVFQLNKGNQDIIKPSRAVNHNTKIRAHIITGTRIILDSGDRMTMLGNKTSSSWLCKDDDLTVKSYHERFIRSGYNVVGGPAKLFKMRHQDIPYWQLVFYEEEEGSIVGNKAITLTVPPMKMLRKDNYVLVSYSNAVSMWHLEHSLDKPAWNFILNEVDYTNNPLHGISSFLTNKFCGFIRRVRGAHWLNQHTDGYFELTLLDNETGKKIDQPEAFFSSCFNSHVYETWAMPIIVAEGNTVCFIGNNFMHEFKALCVKVEKRMMKWEVDMEEVDLKEVLLDKCIKDEETMAYAVIDQVPEVIIENNGIKILGMVNERVILGQLEFEYLGTTSTYQTTALFTIDTDAFFGDTSRILNFPLIGKYESVLDYRKVSYWPHFMANNANDKKEEPKIRGVIEVDNSLHCRGRLTAYNFRRSLNSLIFVD